MTIKKSFSIFALCMFAVSVFGFSTKERMASYIAQGQFPVIVDIAKSVYSEKQGNYSEDDMYALSLGGIASLYFGDSITAQKYAQIVFPYYIKKYENAERNFKNWSTQEKREFLSEFALDYQIFYPLLLVSENIYQVQFSNLHHQIAVKNRNILRDGTIAERARIPLILQSDILWLMLNNRMEMALLSHYPSLMELAKSCTTYPERIMMAISIKSFFDTFNTVVTNMAFLTDQNGNCPYIEKVTNFLLADRELELFIGGNKESYNYYAVNWKDIQNHLNSSDIVEFLINTNILTMPMTCLLEFDKYSEIPKMNVISILKYKVPIASYMNSSGYDTKNVYMSIQDNSLNEDVVYTSDNIHLKMSLYDLCRSTNNRSYDQKDIEVIADVKYGEKSNLEPLNDSKRLIRELESLSPKVHVLSGNNVKRINFLNIVDDISIFHISTHGKIEHAANIELQDTLSVVNAFFNKNDLDAMFLCLSGYNGEHSINKISANDIQKMVKLPKNCLVFLDACNTAQTRNSTVIGEGSLTKAFYIAGARLIISYLGTVNEKVATDFAIEFYKKVLSNSSVTYHNAFYETKKEIIEKYKNTMYLKENDEFGRPRLDILLWE